MDEQKNHKLSKKVRVATIVLLLFFVVFVFYWYEWKPQQQKKECYYIAQDAATAKFDEIATERKDAGEYGHQYPAHKIGQGVFLRGDFQGYYSQCYMQHGLGAAPR